MINKIKQKIMHLMELKRQKKELKKNVEDIKRIVAKAEASKKLIIDCGFNTGEVAACLIESLDGFDYVGFEIQKELEKFGEKLKLMYKDRNINVIFKGVSARDGIVNYFEPTKWGKNYKGGTTTSVEKSKSSEYTIAKSAESIDIGRWILEKTEPDTFIFMKMDIEGSEYEIISHLIECGAISRINILAVEWHAHKFNVDEKKKYTKIENVLRRKIKDAGVSLIEWY